MVNLHRAEGADWLKIAAKRRNGWQRVAASTHGWITPGNAVTLSGGVIAGVGLYLIAYYSIWAGTVLLGLGRLADLADGVVADKTGTKSPLGEAFDAVMDKTVLGLALIFLLTLHLLPWGVGIFMALQGAYNTVLNIAASQRKYQIHPSRAGKLGAALQWVCVGLYLFVAALAEHNLAGATVLLVLAVLCFGGYAVLSLQASFDYSRRFRAKRAGS